MQFLSYDLPYNIYVLLFGVYVSMKTACSSLSAKHWRLFLISCPLLLLLQGAVMLLWDADAVRFFYPLITHLPMILIIVRFAHVRWDIALVSVAISYSICQLPRWLGLLLSMLPLPPAAFVCLHIAASHLLLLLLDRFCLPSVHRVISSRPRLLVCMGMLPLVYYAYEYFLLYTNRRFAHLLLLSELLPTGLVLFFVLFAVVYHQEMEKRAQAEQQMSTLKMRLHQAGQEMETLRAIKEQTAVFRHDMHHHLAVISGFLASGKPEAAAQYIGETRQKIDAIAPAQLCEHEAANLLLCAYKSKSDASGVSFHAKADLPQTLSLPDTELVAMLSNGLENALNAVQALPAGAEKSINLLLCVRQGNLLLEIRNPYHGEVSMKDDLPVSKAGCEHYGCLSIRSIAERHHGLCSFTPEGGIFTLRIAIPLS